MAEKLGKMDLQTLGFALCEVRNLRKGKAIEGKLIPSALENACNQERVNEPVVLRLKEAWVSYRLCTVPDEEKPALAQKLARVSLKRGLEQKLGPRELSDYLFKNRDGRRSVFKNEHYCSAMASYTMHILDKALDNITEDHEGELALKAVPLLEGLPGVDVYQLEQWQEIRDDYLDTICDDGVRPERTPKTRRKYDARALADFCQSLHTFAKEQPLV